MGSLVLGICLNLKKKKRKRKERVEQDFLQMGGCLCDNSSMLWEILGHLKICAAHHMHCDLFLEAVVSKSQLWFVRLKKNRFNDKQAPSASSFTHQTWRDDIRAALKIRLYIMIILTKTAKKKKSYLSRYRCRHWANEGPYCSWQSF